MQGAFGIVILLFSDCTHTIGLYGLYTEGGVGVATAGVGATFSAVHCR